MNMLMMLLLIIIDNVFEQFVRTPKIAVLSPLWGGAQNGCSKAPEHINMCSNIDIVSIHPGE